jgi:seryl-tRNA synthetase
MSTLYEINTAICDCVDDETGEIFDADKLNALLMERNAKLENVALWIKNLESDAKAIKAEKDALDKRMKSAENKAKSLKNWLSEALYYLPFETPRVHISFRKSTTAEVDENVISKDWCVEKTTYTPDKKAIKAALESGQKIEGASLAEHQNIQIK